MDTVLAFTSFRELHKLNGSVASSPDFPCFSPIHSWLGRRYHCGGIASCNGIMGLDVPVTKTT